MTNVSGTDAPWDFPGPPPRLAELVERPAGARGRGVGAALPGTGALSLRRPAVDGQAGGAVSAPAARLLFLEGWGAGPVVAGGSCRGFRKDVTLRGKNPPLRKPQRVANRG